MENKPGISWGVYNPIILPNGKRHGNSCRINLLKSSKGWLAIYYDDPLSKGEIIKIFNPKNIVEYIKMMKTLSIYNYMSNTLCPIVKIDMEND